MTLEEIVVAGVLIYPLLNIFRTVASHTTKHRTRRCRACGERVEKSRYREHRRKHYRWGKNDC